MKSVNHSLIDRFSDCCEEKKSIKKKLEDPDLSKEEESRLRRHLDELESKIDRVRLQLQ